MPLSVRTTNILQDTCASLFATDVTYFVFSGDEILLRLEQSLREFLLKLSLSENMLTQLPDGKDIFPHLFFPVFLGMCIA